MREDISARKDRPNSSPQYIHLTTAHNPLYIQAHTPPTTTLQTSHFPPRRSANPPQPLLPNAPRKSQLRLLIHPPNLQPLLILPQHALVMILHPASSAPTFAHSPSTPLPLLSPSPTLFVPSSKPPPKSNKKRRHTFQNCLLASFPPTLFRIFAPPGCSSMKEVRS